MMLKAALGVAAVGVAWLIYAATPIRWDGHLVESAPEGIISGMACVTLVFGTTAGALAGLLGRLWMRAGHESTGPGAVIAFVAVSVVALGGMSIFVVDLMVGAVEPQHSSRVFEVCGAWLFYVAFGYQLFGIVSGRAAGRAPGDLASPGTR